MQFFASAITTLQTLVIALGAGLGVWGVVNLLEGYGSDNPGANAHMRERSKSKQTAITAIPKQEEHGRNVHKPMLYYN